MYYTASIEGQSKYGLVNMGNRRIIMYFTSFKSTSGCFLVSLPQTKQGELICNCVAICNPRISDITNHMMMSYMMSCNSLKFHRHNSQIGNPPVPYPEEGLAGIVLSLSPGGHIQYIKLINLSCHLSCQ